MGYVVAPVLPFFSVRFEILFFLLFGAEFQFEVPRAYWTSSRCFALPPRILL